MKRTLLKCISAMCATALLCTGAFAGEIPYTVSYDYTNNAITVSGVAEADKFVTLQMLTKDTKAEDFVENAEFEKVLWRGQYKSQDGAYSFEIGYDPEIEEGSYEAVLSTNGELDQTYPVFYIVNRDDYVDAVETLNQFAEQSKEDEFIEYATNNKDTLGFDFALYNELGSNNAVKLLYNHIKENAFSVVDAKENTKVFNSLVLAEALNKKAIKNVDAYIGETSIASSDVYKNYEEIAKTEREQEYLTSKMLGVNITSVEELESAVIESIVLSYIYNASGYGYVRDILSEYGELFGIEGSVSDSICKELCGIDFENSDDFIETYNELKKKNGSSGSSGGGGGGGGSSSGKNEVNLDGRYEDVSKPANDVHKVEVFFNDIDGVKWAGEAIISLADMGIVNGESEGYFRPNQNITREEFAKILVCAMGYENEKYTGNLFRDVAENDWFCPYVNIAY